jgi:hypothetical protein
MIDERLQILIARNNDYYKPDSDFGKEIDRISKQQNWAPSFTIRILAAHALGLCYEYMRADMESIIKGVPID